MVGVPEQTPSNAHPVTASVLVVMWVVPAVMAAAVLAWRLQHRLVRSSLNSHLWEVIAPLGVSLFCVGLAVGTWRCRRWAWWTSVVTVAGALMMLTVAGLWVAVGFLSYGPEPRSSDEPPTSGEEVVRGLSILAVEAGAVVFLSLLPMLVLLLTPSCRRVFLSQRWRGP